MLEFDGWLLLFAEKRILNSFIGDNISEKNRGAGREGGRKVN